MHFLDTNLDFEYELTLGLRPQARPMTQRLEAWANLLRLIPECEQGTILNGQTLTSHDQMHCWGWTPRLRASAPPTQPVPSDEAVRRANAKDFSHALEQDMGCAQPHAKIVRTLEEAQTWIEHTSCPWVIKHPLGVSGRDRVLGRGPTCDPRTLRWLERTLQKTCCVAQPWIEVDTERSTQLMLHPDGTFEVLGVLELHTDNTGTFRGHLVHPRHAQAPPLQSPEQLDHIVQAMHDLGYHGPLGIDAIEGTLNGTPTCIPILEINARWTFGHMALFAYRLAPSQVSLRWEHPKRGAPVRLDLPILSQQLDAPGAYRLPEHIDPEHATRSILHIV